MYILSSYLPLVAIMTAVISVDSTSLPPTELSHVLLKQFNSSDRRRRAKKRWNEESVYKYYVTSRGSDGEFIDASNQFFWNKTHGVAMELGAVDGM